MLNKYYLHSIPLRQTVEKRFTDFERGRIISTADAELSDHPNSAVIDEEHIKKLIKWF